MSVIELLEKQRQEIRARIKALNAELQDIDVALSAISNKHLASGSKQTAAPPRIPIDDAVIQAVKNGRRAPATVLAFLSEELGIKTTINSVRTRLSRLKAENRLSRDETGWIMPLNKEAPDSHESGASEHHDDGNGTLSSSGNGVRAPIALPGTGPAHPGELSLGERD